MTGFQKNEITLLRNDDESYFTKVLFSVKEPEISAPVLCGIKSFIRICHQSIVSSAISRVLRYAYGAGDVIFRSILAVSPHKILLHLLDKSLDFIGDRAVRQKYDKLISSDPSHNILLVIGENIGKVPCQLLYH